MEDRWNQPQGPGRISPRQCVANARDDITQAYSQTEYNKAVHHLRGGLDWLRRALEQMAPPDEEPGPKEDYHGSE